MEYSDLLNLPVLSLDSVFKKLVESVNESPKERSELPLVTVYNHAGNSFSGHLVKYNANEGLLILAEIVDAEVSLQYISTAGIQNLQVHRSSRYLWTLSDGNLAFFLEENQAPSNLELKALVQKKAELISQIAKSPIQLILHQEQEHTALSRYQFKVIVELLSDAIVELCKDPLGIEALSESVSSIQLGISEDSESAVLEGEKLLISIPFKNPNKPDIHQNKLQTLIESLL
ncbi:hypothetical protein [Algoriphagus sp. NG3]|uniref:hypothetical protein n=1 Tax=Algoriphagus sp. NG3 TaxID=3097546 RepID=UPI002A830FF5|nr:hypothetical protein [Algoriphagus sp. NG3]WPR75263.1 hypothetical protein SLW71_21610 [Algoriphagus sp. NG3]